MTLVAAYRPQGVPVLLGDFLITGGKAESSRKKIHRIGPNFVVGWTGQRILATQIMTALSKELGGRYVTMTEVDRFLTNRPEDEIGIGDLYLVGWVIDDTPHCFLWNITYPSTLFYEPFHVAGSGKEKFEELLTRETLDYSWGQRRTNIDKAIYSALSATTELYSDEIQERMNRKQGFGYAYELLYFDGHEFRYLDDIAFLGVDSLLNPVDRRATSRPYDLWYRYHNLGDAAFLQVSNLRDGSIQLETIYPVSYQQFSEASYEFSAGSFRSSYYCIYFRLQTTEGDFYRGSLVLADKKDGPSLYEKQENGDYHLKFSNDLIMRIYDNMKADREHRMRNTIHRGWGAAETVQRITNAGSRIQFRVEQTDKCVVLGLMADRKWDQNYNTIDYAIMCCPDATIQIYEKGIAVGPLGKPYTTTDVFGIGVEEAYTKNVVRYYKDNQVLYTSSILPELPLKGAVSLREEGATIKECQIIHP